MTNLTDDMAAALRRGMPYLDNSGSPGGCDGKQSDCDHCGAITSARKALATYDAAKAKDETVVVSEIGYDEFHPGLQTKADFGAKLPDTIQDSELEAAIAAFRLVEPHAIINRAALAAAIGATRSRRHEALTITDEMLERASEAFGNHQGCGDMRAALEAALSTDTQVKSNG